MADTLNQKIVIWTSGQLGKLIGAGECWDLANSALLQAGAGTSSDFGPQGADADYVWGTELADLKDALPGDILQYRNYVMTTTTNIDVTFPDGYGWTDDNEAEITHPHHTSIVATNPGNGALMVYEQNDKGNHEKVKLTPIRWKIAATTTSTSQQSLKRKDNGKIEMAKVITTVDVTVSGKIKAYRPKLK